MMMEMSTAPPPIAAMIQSGNFLRCPWTGVGGVALLVGVADEDGVRVGRGVGGAGVGVKGAGVGVGDAGVGGGTVQVKQTFCMKRLQSSIRFVHVRMKKILLGPSSSRGQSSLYTVLK